MLDSRINEEYFEWLYSKVCDTSLREGDEPYDRFSEGHTFRKLLEMMVALAISMEDIMDDPRLGDRTGQWFWGMIVSLGLNGLYDRNFKKGVAEAAIERFLRREYRSDGRGGLFTIRRCPDDLRDVEILVQRNWYLNNLA